MRTALGVTLRNNEKVTMTFLHLRTALSVTLSNTISSANEKLASGILDKDPTFQQVLEPWLMHYCPPAFAATLLAV